MIVGDKVYLTVIRLIRMSLVIATFLALIRAEWITLFISIITLFLTFLADLFERRYKIDVPIEFEIVTVLFIFATIFLGEIHSFYAKFWWWDALLHTGSALAFGLIGFMIMYTLYQDKKFYGSGFIMVFFSFCFAVSIGAVWEIFEFSMDQIFGFNMQKHGLVDTMWDLIVDVLGAIVASGIGYLYLKKGDAPFLGKTLRRFKTDNPRLFKKKKKKIRKKLREGIDRQVGKIVRKRVKKKS